MGPRYGAAQHSATSGPLTFLLKLCVAHSAGMQLHIANVADTGEVHDHALKAQAVAGVAAGAVTAQVQIPPVVLGLEAQLVHALPL